jgi:hypothetical protein
MVYTKRTGDDILPECNTVLRRKKLKQPDDLMASESRMHELGVERQISRVTFTQTVGDDVREEQGQIDCGSRAFRCLHAICKSDI